MESPLIYVWSGSSLPSYARHSLSIARQNFHGQIIFLAPFNPQIPGIDWADSTNFRSEKFQRFSDNFRLDPHFRGGLWLKAYERFFLLAEFAKSNGVKSGFHSELDNLIVNLDGFSALLDQHGRGIFVPAVSSRSAIASLVYWNDRQVLDALCDFFISNTENENEMDALGRFMRDNSMKCFSFATEQIWDVEHWPYSLSAIEKESGIVDSAGLGMWLFGRGPATTRCTIFTRYKRPESVNWHIEQLRFYPRQGYSISFGLPGEAPVSLRSIHVSSKIFALLRHPFLFRMLVRANKLPIRLPLYPRLHCAIRNLAEHVSKRIGRSQGAPRIMLAPLARALVTKTNQHGLLLSEKARELLLAFEPPAPKRLILPKQDTLDSLDSASSSAELPSAQTGSPERIQRAIEEGGALLSLSTREIADALERVESWPVLLSYANPEEDIVFNRRNGSLEIRLINQSTTRPVVFLCSEKNLNSLERAKGLLGVSRFAPSWNFDPDCQIYRSDVLRTLFPNRSSVTDWIGGETSQQPTLADLYGVFVSQKSGSKHRTTWRASAIAAR